MTNEYAVKDRKIEVLADEVSGVIAGITGGDGWSLDTDLASVGLDSMALLDILAALEERFGVVLTEDLVSEFRSIRGIVRIVEDAVRSSSGKG